MVDFNRDNTLPRDIVAEMKESYLNYSMSVIVSRALPDVRDGLKPVHRRILYGMSELGSSWNRPYKKSARIVGDVLGKYHPHGDSSVYDALVRMAQQFSMRYQLVDGQGNFGSIDGDNAAAMRYTESRMTKLTSEMLKDLEKDTVEWGLNFDETLKEPTVLPSLVPTLLINGSGRTDFQGGSAKDQYNSIFGRLLKLPEKTLVYPAHDYNGKKFKTNEE